MRFQFQFGNSNTIIDHRSNSSGHAENLGFETVLEMFCWVTLCCGWAWYPWQTLKGEDFNTVFTKLEKTIKSAPKNTQSHFYFAYNPLDNHFNIKNLFNPPDFENKIKLEDLENLVEKMPSFDYSILESYHKKIYYTFFQPFLLLGVGCFLSYIIENNLRKKYDTLLNNRQQIISEIINVYNDNVLIRKGYKLTCGKFGAWLELSKISSGRNKSMKSPFKVIKRLKKGSGDDQQDTDRKHLKETEEIVEKPNVLDVLIKKNDLKKESVFSLNKGYGDSENVDGKNQKDLMVQKVTPKKKMDSIKKLQTVTNNNTKNSNFNQPIGAYRQSAKPNFEKQNDPEVKIFDGTQIINAGDNSHLIITNNNQYLNMLQDIPVKNNDIKNKNGIIAPENCLKSFQSICCDDDESNWQKVEEQESEKQPAEKSIVINRGLDKSRTQDLVIQGVSEIKRTDRKSRTVIPDSSSQKGSLKSINESNVELPDIQKIRSIDSDEKDQRSSTRNNNNKSSMFSKITQSAIRNNDDKKFIEEYYNTLNYQFGSQNALKQDINFINNEISTEKVFVGQTCSRKDSNKNEIIESVIQESILEDIE